MNINLIMLNHKALKKVYMNIGAISNLEKNGIIVQMDF